MMKKSQFVESNLTYQTNYKLGTDIDGNIVPIIDLHKLLLDMVLEFDRVCRKNNIPYALAFGSTLGIVNWGGFIPWDDDVDIAIDYFDIPRLIKALKEDLSDEYYFDCVENDIKYNILIPTLKIRKKETYIKEVNGFQLPNRCKGDGVFIDVIAFMGVPKEEKEHRKILKYAKRRMPFYVFFDVIFRLKQRLLKKRMKMFENKIAYQYKDSDYVAQTVIIPFQDWGNNYKLSYPRDIIYPFKEYDFEGHKLYSFNNPVEFCKLKFGPDCINVKENGQYVNYFLDQDKKMKHFKKFSLTRSKK